MCLKPKKIISNDTTYQVECGQCWQCRTERVNDLVGRALAEAHTAQKAVTVTLTYGRTDDKSESIINPLHAQKFVRALRRRGYKLRYLIAGEYGKLRGRAHFHAVLFFYGNKVPNWPQRQRILIPEWPHGFFFADHVADEKVLRYSLKYALKDTKRGQNGWAAWSKKPPLGYAFFQEKAQGYIKNGLMPQSLRYHPPSARPNRRGYRLKGVTRDWFLSTIAEGLLVRGIDPFSRSSDPAVEAAIWKADKWAGERRRRDVFLYGTDAEKAEIMSIEAEQFEKHLDSKRPSDAAIAMKNAWLDFIEAENGATWQTEPQYSDDDAAGF